MPAPLEYLKLWPLAVAFTVMIGGDAVQAYQIEQHDEAIDTLEDVQVQQAVTEKDIEYIQKDVENMQDDVKENKELLIKILNKLEN